MKPASVEFVCHVETDDANAAVDCAREYLASILPPAQLDQCAYCETELMFSDADPTMCVVTFSVDF